MKMLKKLALVSAISMISAGAFAMEAMDDESMAATTGQDGITIKVIPGQFTDATAMATAAAAGYKAGPDVKALGIASGYKGLSVGEIRIHDDDGLGVQGTDNTANSGALVIGGGYDANNDGDFLDAGDITVAADKTNVFTNQAKSIQIDLDMVGNIDGGVGNKPMLNVKISTPSLRIQTGAIYVANSNAADAALFDADGVSRASATEIDGTQVAGKVKILDGMGLTMGAATINVQLGNEAQGAMIKLDTAITGGLVIDNVGLNDSGQAIALTQLGDTVTSGGKIFIKQMKINDNAGTDLTVKVNVDVGSVNTAVPTFAAGQLTTFNDTAAANYGYADYSTLSTVAGGAPSPAQAQAAAIKAGVDANRALLIGNEPTLAAGYNGLVIGLQQVGSVANGMDISMTNLRLGDDTAAVMGDIQILGLNISGTNVVIMGH